MISYEPFWDTLDLSDESTYTLIKKYHISSSTLNRMRHNKDISTVTIDKLCKILECDVYSIMEYKSDEDKQTVVAIPTT